MGHLLGRQVGHPRTLIGAAIKDGRIKSLDDPVTDYLPEMKGSAYDGVTIRQLVTMTSGVKWNEDYTDPKSDVAVSSNWLGERGVEPLVSYMRRLPRDAAPGTHFSYKTGETDLAGILLARAVHEPLAKYLSDKIWRPYGMEKDAVWMLDRGGLERGGCCIGLTMRRLPPWFAEFIAGGGMIDRRSILPDGWLAQATVQSAEDAERLSLRLVLVAASGWLRGHRHLRPVDPLRAVGASDCGDQRRPPPRPRGAEINAPRTRRCWRAVKRALRMQGIKTIQSKSPMPSL